MIAEIRRIRDGCASGEVVLDEDVDNIIAAWAKSGRLTIRADENLHLFRFEWNRSYFLEVAADDVARFVNQGTVIAAQCENHPICAECCNAMVSSQTKKEAL